MRFSRSGARCARDAATGEALMLWRLLIVVSTDSASYEGHRE